MNKTTPERDDSAASCIESPFPDLHDPSKSENASIMQPDTDVSRRERFQDALEKTGKRYARAFEELAK